MDSVREYISPERVYNWLSFVREYPWYIAGTAVVGMTLYRVLNRPRGLPPGPWGWPVIGAITELSDQMHEDCVRLGKKYGDVFSFYTFGE